MTYPQYAPWPESLPWRLCKYFIENPKARMSRLDICREFGIMLPNGVGGNIRIAVAKGVFIESRNSDDKVVWSKGPNTNIKLRDPKEVPEVGDGEEMDRQPSHTSPFGHEAHISVSSIPVTKLPLNAEKRAEAEFNQWLASFEVGNTAVFSIHWLDQFRKPVQRYSASTKRRFVLVTVDTNRAGIERTE